MSSICLRCSKVLPEMDGKFVFCPFCGQKLDRPESSSTVEESQVSQSSSLLDSQSTTEFRPLSQQSLRDEEPEAVPEVVGQYRIGKFLGKGGMGQVFEALSVATEQIVAVKLLSARLAGNPVSVERFRQEGRLASQISHPNCVFVYAADTDQGRPYIVMERMPGETLKDLVERKGPRPYSSVLQYALDIIEGLKEAHRLGFIHRNVKPSNCFLTRDGQVKIGDFGLSRSLSTGSDLTQTGTFLGTILYASPEQIRGEEVDFDSDVYSVCATLFFLLTGRAPFQQDHMTAALAQIIEQDAPDVRSFTPDCPKGVAAVIARGLERDRNRRYRNLDELEEAIQQQIPTQLTKGSLGVRFVAYIVDELLLQLAILLPFALLGGSRVGNFHFVAEVVLFLAYFTILEGLYGASLGKKLLGLRVCRVGMTDPPGLSRALWRTSLFALLVAIRFWDEAFFQESTDRRTLQFLFSVWLVVGIPLILLPMRSSRDYRGFHERRSGTAVFRRPFRPKPIRLRSPGSNPFERMNICKDFPRIKPYVFERGEAGPGTDEFVFLARDPVLGRTILILLTDPNWEPPSRRRSLTRTTRPRLLASGHTEYRDKVLSWHAFICPGGLPLEEICQPGETLRWPEARLLLEQLVEELCASQEEKTTPERLSLNQVWVQPDGRLQLLDFPLPDATRTVKNPAADAPHLVRQTLQLSLEGTISQRDSAGAIRAPLPGHASEFIRVSLEESTQQSLDVLRGKLIESRKEPRRVDTPQRLFQLGVQAASLAFGLFLIFTAAGAFSVLMVLSREIQLRQGQVLISYWEKNPGWHPAATERPENNLDLLEPTRLKTYLLRQQRDKERYEVGLSFLERKLMQGMLDSMDEGPMFELNQSYRSLQQSSQREVINDSLDANQWWRFSRFILAWPFAWGLLAFFLRGGVSLWFTGIRLVQTSGQPASRIQAFLRAFLPWILVSFCLVGSVWLQAFLPEYPLWHVVAWWGALGVVGLYFLHALRNPEATWLDQKLGLLLVPK